MSRWCQFDPFGPLPAMACVYAIYVDGALTYIGQTENLNARIRQHALKKNPSLRKGEAATPWSAYSAKPTTVTMKVSFSDRRYAEWLMREARLIRRLQPVGNIRGVTARNRRPVRPSRQNIAANYGRAWRYAS